MVLDRRRLPSHAQRQYDRIIEGPIKTALSTARKQLKQSRVEFPDTSVSILFILNNGYTALDHDALVRLVAHRVRNDTKEIDGIVCAGCYFYSDTFDSYFLWPITYVPINLSRAFVSYENLREAWNGFAGRFMTAMIRGQIGQSAIKGPVIDTQFDVDGVTYVKPAPPMGEKSEFFVKGRPRNDSSGIEHCPAVAITFPDMTFGEWVKFRKALPYESGLFDNYEDWQAFRIEAVAAGMGLKPFVGVSIISREWQVWRKNRQAIKAMSSIQDYANEIFNKKVRSVMACARERSRSSIIPPRYIFAVTEEIGQDRANDLSHIALIREAPGSTPNVRELITDARIFHEHALVLACAYAVAEGVDYVLWQKEQRYAWV